MTGFYMMATLAFNELIFYLSRSATPEATCVFK